MTENKDLSGDLRQCLSSLCHSGERPWDLKNSLFGLAECDPRTFEQFVNAEEGVLQALGQQNFEEGLGLSDSTVHSIASDADRCAVLVHLGYASVSVWDASTRVQKRIMREYHITEMGAAKLGYSRLTCQFDKHGENS